MKRVTKKRKNYVGERELPTQLVSNKKCERRDNSG